MAGVIIEGSLLRIYENSNSDGFPPTMSSPENKSLRKQHKNRFSKSLNTDRMASSPQAQCVTEKTKPTILSSRRKMKSPSLKPLPRHKAIPLVYQMWSETTLA